MPPAKIITEINIMAGVQEPYKEPLKLKGIGDYTASAIAFYLFQPTRRPCRCEMYIGFVSLLWSELPINSF